MEEKKKKKQSSDAKRIIEIDSTLTRFEVPPLQDTLIIGRDAPIGTKAMQRAVEFISKGNYVAIPFANDEIVESVIVRRCILRMVSKEILISFIKEEISPKMCSKDMLKVRLEIILRTKKSYQF